MNAKMMKQPFNCFTNLRLLMGLDIGEEIEAKVVLPDDTGAARVDVVVFEELLVDEMVDVDDMAWLDAGVDVLNDPMVDGEEDVTAFVVEVTVEVQGDETAGMLDEDGPRKKCTWIMQKFRVHCY